MRLVKIKKYQIQLVDEFRGLSNKFFRHHILGEVTPGNLFKRIGNYLDKLKCRNLQIFMIF